MKKIAFIFLLALVLNSCSREKPTARLIDESLDFSLRQYELMYGVIKDKPGLLPRSADKDGNLLTGTPQGWTSGFFPGSLWYLYEYSGNEKMKEAADTMTRRIEDQKYNRGTHDLGFMFNCSYGNGLRLTGNESYRDVMITAARSLLTRFRPNIGLIQSWGSRKGWQCPVIIDNMMNLEFLMNVFRMTNDSDFYKVAVSHADTTIKYHFRPDNSSYHVVSFDTITGRVEAKQTAQGAADESAWARGQSWGLYGFSVMYRETKLERYLRQAEKIADFLISHPNLPEDKIPYWDYNAPGIPQEKRDASAGAIMCSALIELSGYTDADRSARYLSVAEKQLRSLASPVYRAKKGENANFILMHSVGSLPAKSEVDVPLTYADYYFIEAMLRFRKLL